MEQKRPEPRLRRAEAALFARNFLRHPKMLGSVVPSSRFLTQAVLRRINFSAARVVVEYGPGVGVMTAKILRRMRLDAHLVAIEINPELATFLRNRHRDPRLHVIEGSAADVEQILRELGHEAADYVISGIPFSTLPPPVRNEILVRTRNVLAPGGSLIVYQFSARVYRDLQHVFSRVDRGFEPLNLLPAHIFHCLP